MKSFPYTFFALLTALFFILFPLFCPQVSAGPLLDRLLQSRANSGKQKESLKEYCREIIRDLPYGQAKAQTMDIYLPDMSGKGHEKKAPVIFMVHGGGWRTGDKTHSRVTVNKVRRWVPKGFIFISANNRLRPEADPLEQAQDICHAIAQAQKKVKSLGGDPDKFILMGHSAGAHLVTLVNSIPEMAYKAGARPWLGTVSLDSGAIDVVSIMESRHPAMYDNAFGDDPLFWKKASPYHNLSSGAKPLLLVCAANRRKALRSAEKFIVRAKSLELNCQQTIELLSHGEINENLGLESDYTARVEKFMAGLNDDVREALDRNMNSAETDR